MEDKKRLDKVTWIGAGFRALCESGAAGLKAEPLARALGVSKGSFYWHFTNLAAFRQAMIDHWVSVATEGIIESVEGHSLNPVERLRFLVQLSTEPPPQLMGGAGAEGALRCWGRADAIVGERLRLVDEARLNYCAKLFQECGLVNEEAQLRGRMLYAALVGLEQLDQSGLARMRSDLEHVLDMLLT